MAYSVSHNLPTNRAVQHRPAHDKTLTHRHYQTHLFDDIGTTAKELNTAIVAAGSKVLACRTHVEFTVTHATATVYVGFTPDITTSVGWQYKLGPSGGYAKIPLDPDHKLYYISDTASSTTATITERG